MTSCGYDAELRRHNEVLRQACAVRSHDHVLDIGCGSGQTTREAARAARAGSALGVDVSASAVERARELAYAERIRNVAFSRALRPAGRLVMMVRQSPERNEWDVTIRHSLGGTVLPACPIRSRSPTRPS